MTRPGPGAEPDGPGVVPDGPEAGPDPPESATARELAVLVGRLRAEAARARAEERVRAVADLATGMLAERLDVPITAAAAELARLARQSGVPTATLAADILGQAPPVQPPPEQTAREQAEPKQAAREQAAPEQAAREQAEPKQAAQEQAAPEQPAPVPGLALVPDLQRAAEAVLDQTRAASGAHAVAVWRRLPDGALALAARAGLPAAEAAAWSRVPPGIGTPAERVITTGGELWPDAAAPPAPPAPSAPALAPGSARAVLPLLVAGRRRGALEVLWPAPGPSLGRAERRSLQGLADLCATLLGATGPPGEAAGPGPGADDRQAAVLDGLLTPALLLEPVLRDGRVADFTVVRTGPGFLDPLGRPAGDLDGASLLESYPVACAAGLLDLLLDVHRSGEPRPRERLRLRFHDDASIPAVTLHLAVAPLGARLLVGWQPEVERPGEAEQDALLRQAQRLARVAGFEEQPGTGRIRWSDGLTELYGLPPGADPVPFARLARYAHRDDRPAVRRLIETVQQRHRTSSAVFRLARPDGTHRYTRVVAEPVLDADGRLTLVRGAYHDVSAQHRTEVALGAVRARLADSEQETAESEQLALRLQQAILPPAPPPLGATGLRAAVRYRPAAQRDRVGGDWYDVLLLPDKQVLLAVGDIAGHGVGAATGMVALRHALRGLAVTGAGPGRLLEWANTVALRDPAQVTATAVCVLLDPVGGSLHWARAGHLPPIRVGPGGAEVLPLPHGVLLGALEGAEYEEYGDRLAVGDVLLLYTDGLVERRDRPVEESVEQLIRSAGAPGPDLEAYLDRLLELSQADTDDDTCLIAVRVEPGAGG